MVAIKLLPPDAAGDAHANDRFKQEARAVAALNHPHICTLYDVGEAPSLETGSSESIRFLVMEYVEGTGDNAIEFLARAAVSRRCRCRDLLQECLQLRVARTGGGSPEAGQHAARHPAGR